MKADSTTQTKLLIDEAVLGLEPFLKDLGWKTVGVKPGTSDDEVVRMAQADNCIVITPDRRLLSRCRALGIEVIDVGFEDLARRVNERLKTHRSEK